ncbi:uncharacterized protein LOC114535693 isoform X1 [Dendronephthya gigantea]|uniref:uncharacterized protein LOC114535693 isoform X1 n=1 Tax=Dendronephthya gigantea TaxID=151771 RepID=UPI00106B6824|nr:uncharacterized protein LOC114535693 isoform X1 [Dendronephthya gigantea]
MKLKTRCQVLLTAVAVITICTAMYFFHSRQSTKKCRDVSEHGDPWIINSTKAPLLPVPKDIEMTVGPEEWISRTINDPNVKLQECPSLLQLKKNDSDLACRLPEIDPFHPSIMKLFSDVANPNCAKHKSYGKLVNGKIQFLDPEVISANYRRIIRQGDFKFILGKSVPVPAMNTEEKITDEFIEVEYLLKNKKNVKEIFLQPVPHEHLVKRKAEKQPGIPLNILIIGVDSLSHANTQRRLPNVYKYLKNELGAMFFNGHSIVGDGTTEQLTAMLTGQGELEQYESRRHHKNPKPVDGWSWIYKQLKERGYVTGYSGDWPIIGPWQYRLMGFENPPTDFYTRPFFSMAEKFVKTKDQCLASKTISNVQFDYIQEVFDVFKNQLKFFFSFNVRYSHNSNSETSKIEPDLLSLLKGLKQNNHLNNTLLIIMGDHGTRYGKIRTLVQGKLEERLPLYTMAFPKWFLREYPEISKNLKLNTNRLTSWYDVYATFRHMLSYPEVPADIKHGQSLLIEVPISRTCSQANVEEHWCPCLEWVDVNLGHSHLNNSALAAVEFMNNANLEHKKSAENCQKLSLKNINYALFERPNDKVLSFKQTNDLKAAFSDKSRPNHKDFCRYQVQFTTIPNNGIYEATVRYHKDWFIVSKAISRVNKYGSQPECIARDLPHLRKYCMCKRTDVREMCF